MTRDRNHTVDATPMSTKTILGGTLNRRRDAPNPWNRFGIDVLPSITSETQSVYKTKRGAELLQPSPSDKQLLHENHLFRCDEIPGTQRVEIDSGCKMGRVKRNNMLPGIHPAVDQRCHFLAQQTEHLQEDVSALRQFKANGGRRIEGIRIVLTQGECFRQH